MTTGKIWQRMKAAVGKFRKRQSSTRRSRAGRRTTLSAECLEQRELLSVNQLIFDAANSRIVVQGTGDADRGTVTADSPSTIRVRAESIDGVVESTFQRSAVSSLYFFGGNGNDRFDNQTDIPSLALGEAGDDTLSGGRSKDELH